MQQDVGSLSGGERGKAALARLASVCANVLVLDEPTNHLDLEMRHALNVALQEFGGAMVIVSHDRFLLRSVTDRWLMVADGTVQEVWYKISPADTPVKLLEALAR